MADLVKGVPYDENAAAVNLALGRIREIDDEIRELKAFRAAHEERLVAEKSMLWQDWGEAIQDTWKRVKESDPGRKSIQFPSAFLQERTFKPEVKIVDGDLAAEWAKTHAPEALKMTVAPEKIGIARGTKLLSEEGEVLVDLEGDVSIPGVSFRPERTQLYVQATRRGVKE